MRALKTGFWVLVVAALLAFAYANDDRVTVHFLGSLAVDTKMWALVIGALLIGFVPSSLMHRTTRWRLSRRIATLEATLAAQAQAANAVLNATTSHSGTSHSGTTNPGTSNPGTMNSGGEPDGDPDETR